MSPSGTERIRSLDPSGRELLRVIGERWRAVGLQTGPAPRDEAENAVRELYERAGLPGPGTILWLKSPLEGAVAAYVMSQELPTVLGPLRRALSFPVQAQLERRFEPALTDEIRTTLGDPFWKAVRHLLRDEIALRPFPGAADRVLAEVRRAGGLAAPAWATPPPWEIVWPQVVSQTYRCGFGQQESGALGFLDFVARWGSPEPALAGLQALGDVSRACGWWWAFREVCILTERPATLLRNALGQLHAETTPALEYADRFGIYAVDGRGVSSGTIRERNERLVTAILTERNAEVRRVMLERLSMDRLVRMGFARGLDVERDRALYEITMAGRPALTVVQVTCPSTGRVYLLGVPPPIRRCHDAVAWTFGLEPHEYAPEQET